MMQNRYNNDISQRWFLQPEHTFQGSFEDIVGIWQASLQLRRHLKINGGSLKITLLLLTVWLAVWLVKYFVQPSLWLSVCDVFRGMSEALLTLAWIIPNNNYTYTFTILQLGDCRSPGVVRTNLFFLHGLFCTIRFTWGEPKIQVVFFPLHFLCTVRWRHNFGYAEQILCRNILLIWIQQFQ